MGGHLEAPTKTTFYWLTSKEDYNRRKLSWEMAAALAARGGIICKNRV